MRSRKLWLPAAAACALALGSWSSSPAAQGRRETGQQLAWGSFMRDGNDYDRYRLSDRDVIRVRVTYSFSADASQRLVSWAVRESAPEGGARDVPRDKVEISLVSGPGVTWWKGITAFRNAPLGGPGSPTENWVRIGHVDTQDDDHGPDSLVLGVADLRDGLMLSFEKAKAFGAHAPVYSFKVPDLAKLGGHRITFTWERDE